MKIGEPVYKFGSFDEGKRILNMMNLAIGKDGIVHPRKVSGHYPIGCDGIGRLDNNGDFYLTSATNPEIRRYQLRVMERFDKLSDGHEPEWPSDSSVS